MKTKIFPNLTIKVKSERGGFMRRGKSEIWYFVSFRCFCRITFPKHKLNLDFVSPNRTCKWRNCFTWHWQKRRLYSNDRIIWVIQITHYRFIRFQDSILDKYLMQMNFQFFCAKMGFLIHITSLLQTSFLKILLFAKKNISIQR
jgi:hypothetical protein